MAELTYGGTSTRGRDVLGQDPSQGISEGYCLGPGYEAGLGHDAGSRLLHRQGVGIVFVPTAMRIHCHLSTAPPTARRIQLFPGGD